MMWRRRFTTPCRTASVFMPRQPRRGDGPGCGRGSGRRAGPAQFDQEGPRSSPRCCTSRCSTPTRRSRDGNSSARRTQWARGESRVGPLPRPRCRDGATCSGPAGELGRPAAGVHQLRRDRPVPRRSHRLREPVAARLCAHRVARRRGDVSWIRFGGSGVGRLPGKRHTARSDASPVVRRLAGSSGHAAEESCQLDRVELGD